MRKSHFGLVLASLMLTVSACADHNDAPGAGAAGDGGAPGGVGSPTDGGSGGDGPSPALELIGRYDDGFGNEVVITQDYWDKSAIRAYDNELNVVYTQFPADDQYNPNKFAKTVYTELENGAFYYCLVVYSASTLSEAQADTTPTDDSDPDNGGCASFPWSKATVK